MGAFASASPFFNGHIALRCSDFPLAIPTSRDTPSDRLRSCLQGNDRVDRDKVQGPEDCLGTEQGKIEDDPADHPNRDDHFADDAEGSSNDGAPA